MEGPEDAPVVHYVAAGASESDPVFETLSGVSGIDVRTATEETLLEAVESGDVDGVVCRHGGDGLDGVAVLEGVRGLDASVPFVLVAADESVAHRAVAADVTEYVPLEEYGPDAVTRRLRAAVADRTAPAGTGSMSIPGLSQADELALKERALEAAPVGITISDSEREDNPLVYLNDDFERITGYAKGEVVGRNCRFLQGDDTDPEAVAEIRRAVDEDYPETTVLRNYRKDGEGFWNELHVSPIRDAEGTVTNYVGFQVDVTERVEAKRQLEAERETLATVLERIEGLVGDVTAELVQGGDREALQGHLCRRIVTEDIYQFAWVGRRDRTRDDLAPAAWDGAWLSDREDLIVSLDYEGESPALSALNSGTLTVVDEPAAIERIAAERGWLPEDPVGTIAAIPLTYADTTYGVLTVCTRVEAELTDPERVVLQAIARATATTINAIERGQLITATNVVELEFDLATADHFFVGLSAAGSCRLAYRGAVTQADGTLAVFFETDGDVEDLLAAAETHQEITRLNHVTTVEHGDLIAVTVTASSLVDALGQRGGRIRSLTAEDGAATLTVDIPAAADPRAFVEVLAERYPESSLLAFRERERPPTTKGEFISDVTDTLTARQLTALRTAHVSGYFEADRSVSGDTLADAMDVSPSTFHQHLRAAQRKLLTEFFANETGPSPR